MTTAEAYNLQPGERLLKLTDKEISIIYRALDQAVIEAENERTRYIQRNAIARYDDLISDGLAVQIAELSDLRAAIDNGSKELK